MTTEEIIEYYVNLLIIQYRNKPKAEATIELLASMPIMDQLPLDVQNGFDVDTSVGVQLDILGEYVGVSRSGYTPDGPVTLDDDDFRKLILLAIIKNNSGSSLYDINYLLNVYFPGQILVSDNQLMQLNYFMSTDLGSENLLAMIVYQDMLPAPMGVQVSVTVVPPGSENYFGFRDYSGPAVNRSPFNSYPLYQLNYPWFSYQDPVFV